MFPFSHPNTTFPSHIPFPNSILFSRPHTVFPSLQHFLLLYSCPALVPFSHPGTVSRPHSRPISWPCAISCFPPCCFPFPVLILFPAFMPFPISLPHAVSCFPCSCHFQFTALTLFPVHVVSCACAVSHFPCSCHFPPLCSCPHLCHFLFLAHMLFSILVPFLFPILMRISHAYAVSCAVSRTHAD